MEFYKITNQRIEQRQREEEAKLLRATEELQGQPAAAPQHFGSYDSAASSCSPDRKKLIGTSPEKENAAQASSNHPSSQNDDVKALQGEFFGTDFNFLYSEEMQRALATNCLSANWDSLMNFSQH